MAHVTEPAVGTWPAADLVERFGPVPLSRIRLDPAPGTASEEDVVEIHDHEDRLYELVDGVLLEKTVGTYESYLAALLVHLMWAFVKEHDLGIVLGADGMMRLAPGLVRIPDAAFISWARLPGRRIPHDPIADLAPDLAVEVLSKSNTPKEMERKLSDYFAAAVRQVWYVYPDRREVRVYVALGEPTLFTQQQTLGGGDLLPGFSLELQGFFAEPGQGSES
jgi:Uma2 family endonuclease